MRLANLIEPDAVVFGLRARDKLQVIENLARDLAARTRWSEADVRDALLAREGVGSTGVGHGVALPHAWIAGIAESRGVFARLAEAIEFDAVDGKPVDLVCAVVGPDSSVAGTLSSLARVARVLRDGRTAQDLRHAPDARSFHAVLMAADAREPESQRRG